MSRPRPHLLGTALFLFAIALTARLGAAVTFSRDLGPEQHASHTGASSSRLVERVLETTAIFRDVAQAIGYEPFGSAWQDKPKGTFADWNPRVSCDGQ